MVPLNQLQPPGWSRMLCQSLASKGTPVVHGGKLHRVDMTIQVNSVLSQSAESRAESERACPLSPGAWTSFGGQPSPAHWPLCEEMPATLRTRVIVPGLPKASAQYGQALGFTEPT